MSPICPQSSASNLSHTQSQMKLQKHRTAPGIPQAKDLQHSLDPKMTSPSPCTRLHWALPSAQPLLTILTRSHTGSLGCLYRHGPTVPPSASLALHKPLPPPRTPSLTYQPHICVQQAQPSLWPSSDVSTTRVPDSTECGCHGCHKST